MNKKVKVLQAKLATFFISMFCVVTSQISFAGHHAKDEAQNVNLDEVSVTSSIDSRIAKHPATVETFDKKQISESVNAVRPAQTLKYLPSI